MTSPNAPDEPRLDGERLLADLLDDPVAALERHTDAVPELAAMRRCPQPANHHAEGDVWEHTRLALEVAASLVPSIEQWAGDELRGADLGGAAQLELPVPTATHLVAVLLHDVAKPLTIRGGNGSWTYYGHEAVGARVAKGLLERLSLADAATRLGVAFDADAVVWAIAEHLFWLNTDVERVTDAAVARRFVRDDGRGELLRIVSWCDGLGSRGATGRPYVALLVAAERRIRDTRARAAAAAALPPPLLDGGTVMATLGLQPGPRVGAVLAWVRARAADESDALALLSSRAAWLREAPLDDVRDERVRSG